MKITAGLIKSKSPDAKYLSQIQYLNLSNSNISSISDALSACTNLDTLILSNNNIEVVGDSLATNTQLWKLNLSCNSISCLDGFCSFQVLGSLNLAYNKLDWSEIRKLTGMKIIDLYLYGNDTLEMEPGYRNILIDLLPNIWSLDGKFITSTERREAKQYCRGKQGMRSPVKRQGFISENFTSTSQRKLNKSKLKGKKAIELFRNIPTNSAESYALDCLKLKVMCNNLAQLHDLEIKSSISRGGKTPSSGEVTQSQLFEKVISLEYEEKFILYMLLISSLEFELPPKIIELMLESLGSVKNVGLQLLAIGREWRAMFVSVLQGMINVEGDCFSSKNETNSSNSSRVMANLISAGYSNAPGSDKDISRDESNGVIQASGKNLLHQSLDNTFEQIMRALEGFDKYSKRVPRFLRRSKTVPPTQLSQSKILGISKPVSPQFKDMYGSKRKGCSRYLGLEILNLILLAGQGNTFLSKKEVSDILTHPKIPDLLYHSTRSRSRYDIMKSVVENFHSKTQHGQGMDDRQTSPEPAEDEAKSNASGEANVNESVESQTNSVNDVSEDQGDASALEGEGVENLSGDAVEALANATGQEETLKGEDASIDQSGQENGQEDGETEKVVVDDEAKADDATTNEEEAEASPANAETEPVEPPSNEVDSHAEEASNNSEEIDEKKEPTADQEVAKTNDEEEDGNTEENKAPEVSSAPESEEKQSSAEDAEAPDEDGEKATEKAALEAGEETRETDDALTGSKEKLEEEQEAQREPAPDLELQEKISEEKEPSQDEGGAEGETSKPASATSEDVREKEDREEGPEAANDMGSAPEISGGSSASSSHLSGSEMSTILQAIREGLQTALLNGEMGKKATVLLNSSVVPERLSGTDKRKLMDEVPPNSHARPDSTVPLVKTSRGESPVRLTSPRALNSDNTNPYESRTIRLPEGILFSRDCGITIKTNRRARALEALGLPATVNSGIYFTNNAFLPERLPVVNDSVAIGPKMIHKIIALPSADVAMLELSDKGVGTSPYSERPDQFMYVKTKKMKWDGSKGHWVLQKKKTSNSQVSSFPQVANISPPSFFTERKVSTPTIPQQRNTPEQFVLYAHSTKDSRYRRRYYSPV
eukprot:Nk52_evm30s1569 gene=Nk52_evmTU30s1569